MSYTYPLSPKKELDMRIIKDSSSNGGDCPALYKDQERDDEPGFIVQGKFLTADERAQLIEVGADEDAVWIPANVLDQYVLYNEAITAA